MASNESSTAATSLLVTPPPHGHKKAQSVASVLKPLSQESNRRLAAAIQELAIVYGRIKMPAKILPKLLEVASAVDNCDSANDFLKKHPIFDSSTNKESDKVTKMEDVVNGNIRKALMQ
jgi:phage gp36-like protein